MVKCSLCEEDAIAQIRDDDSESYCCARHSEGMFKRKHIEVEKPVIQDVPELQPFTLSANPLNKIPIRHDVSDEINRAMSIHVDVEGLFDMCLDYYHRLEDRERKVRFTEGCPMKKEYIDHYGCDSLPELKVAAKHGCDMFITSNESLLADRKELEKVFRIKIRRPDEL